MPRLDQQLATCGRVIARHQTTVAHLTEELTALQTWQMELQAQNRSNPHPPRCRVRMDSGFGSGPNLAWLIEMGYEIDTKALNDKTTQALRTPVTDETTWQRVGENAEMTAWTNYAMHGCPYPLQVGLEHFKIGATTKYATLVRVAANSSAWVQQTPSGTALQFAPTSALPGMILILKGVPALQLPLGFQEPCKITTETTNQALVAQSSR